MLGKRKSCALGSTCIGVGKIIHTLGTTLKHCTKKKLFFFFFDEENSSI